MKTALLVCFQAWLAAAGPPWASRSAIPGGCVPTTKVPDNGRCLFSDQCASDFCCPFFKSCLNPSLSGNAVVNMGDTLRSAMIWGQGGAKTASYQGSGSADVCGDRPSGSGQTDTSDPGRCGEVGINGAAPTPILEDSGVLVAYDLTHTSCNCDSRFIAEYSAGTWVGTFENGAFVNYCPLPAAATSGQASAGVMAKPYSVALGAIMVGALLR
mmetsp:Transcript_53333/g.114602  ORF Transcript_53333/g.114602 Transcript_53333/m.114602 type:complete len:213 (-) Transcript_53333:49-687(-)